MRIHDFALGVLLVIAPALGAQAQATVAGEYSRISIEAGLLKANLDGTLDELTGGVRIVLKSDKPEVKPLPIAAATMKFNWPKGASTPVSIVMDGKVEIEHPQATVHSQHAEWNFEKGTVVFTGSPVMSSTVFKEMRAKSVTIDFEAGTLEAEQGSVSEVQLNQAGMGGGSNPNLLAASDVSDWTGLITALKEQGKAQTPSPGRQILAQLDRQAQSVLINTPAADLAKDPSLLVKQFNAVLRKPGLYNAEAWQGTTLGEEAQGLLKQEKLSVDDQIRLNRLLLQAAYPQFIKEM
ncbi:MAG: hypothetical protein HYV26_17785 [Candidatus Hydrogenedentes bacterium]|nr:hypothetical protein [Candidatus Hydrogenedentota bacterium]